jgi:putative SOS response-associated peptidase YedK
MINARAETLDQRPAFRDAFARFRCLILADGFYEWAATAMGRRAFHITRAGAEPFAFAGLWARWRSADTEIRSCAIITTAANRTLAPLHDRMPVILEPAAEATWLDPGTPPQVLHDLLRPLADGATRIREVGPAVNDARYDGPECLAAPAEPAPTLF